MEILNKYELEQNIRTKLDKFIDINVVDKINVCFTRANVNYVTGIKRSYYLDKLDPYTMWMHPINIGNEFTVFPGFEHLKKFFKISQYQLSRAGFCDKEVVIQQVINMLLTEGWIHTDYPHNVLKSSWDSIVYENYIADNKLILCPASYSKSLNGWHIQATFYDYSSQRGILGRSYREVWKDPRFLYNMIIKLIASGSDITRTNLIRLMNSTHKSYKNRIGRKFRSPGFYMALFKMLNLEYKSIYDMNPVNMAKAIATSKLKIDYNFMDENMNYIAYNQFLESINEIPNINNISLYDKNFDVLLLDDNLDTYVDVKPYLKLLGKRYKTIVAMDKTDGIPVSYFDNQKPAFFLKIYN